MVPGALSMPAHAGETGRFRSEQSEPTQLANRLRAESEESASSTLMFT